MTESKIDIVIVLLIMLIAILTIWLGIAGPLVTIEANYGGTIPQWITLCIALFAFAAAVWSVISQREIARKRAAMDFFIKTEMDAQILKAHADYKSGVAALSLTLARGGSLERFESTDHGKSVRSYLNLHELIAVGIHRKVFDDHVCYHYWSGELTRSYRECGVFINYLRDQPGNKNLFRDFVIANNRWLRRPERLHE